MSKEDKIPQTETATSLFLASQLKEEVSKIKDLEPQHKEQSDDYGEEVSDYGFEQ